MYQLKICCKENEVYGGTERLLFCGVSNGSFAARFNVLMRCYTVSGFVPDLWVVMKPIEFSDFFASGVEVSWVFVGRSPSLRNPFEVLLCKELCTIWKRRAGLAGVNTGPVLTCAVPLNYLAWHNHVCSRCVSILITLRKVQKIQSK